MKFLSFLILIMIPNISVGQELTFDIHETKTSQFGSGSDLVNFVPLFKLTSEYLNNGEKNLSYKKLPSTIDHHNLAYGFINFEGLENSLFGRELAVLVENYGTEFPKVFIDRNGNLDFTDDGLPIKLDGLHILELPNSTIKKAVYSYEMGKSQVKQENERVLIDRFIPRFPKNSIVSAKHWLTLKRLSIRVSSGFINENPITILISDNNSDGIYTFQTDSYGDRILIVEGEVDLSRDLTSTMRQAEPIDHNAVFELFGENYFVKHLKKNGNNLTISKTSEKTRVVFKDGYDISSFSITLLDATRVSIDQLVENGRHLLIDVGGTWCGGCKKQQPVIKNLYNAGRINVLGLFDYDTIESVSKYAKANDLEWPVALVDSTFRNMFRVTSFPTYILVSPEGEIILGETESEKIDFYLSERGL